MKKTTIKKLITSLTISTLIIGLIAPSAVSGDELEEPVVDEVEKIETNDVNENEEAVEELDEVEDIAEEPASDEKESEITVKATSEVAPLAASTLVADTTTLEEAFPDVNFRTWVYETALGHGTGTYVDDSHKTTTMSQSEINSKITGRTAAISIANKEISSLDGIEYFTSITNLNASGNKLSGELDLSNLSSLKTLTIYTNQLTKIHLSDSKSITTLQAQSNQLVELDTSVLVNVTKLQVNTNKLKELDLSNMPELVTLWANGNELSGEMDLTNSTKLQDIVIYNNQLTKLNISNITTLKTITVYSNQLEELNITGSTAITTLQAQSNLIEEIDEASLANVTKLQINGNKLKELDTSNMPELLTLWASDNNLKGELDLTNSTKLQEISIINNQITKVDLSNITTLKTVVLYSNQLEELDISGSTSIVTLQVQNNKLKELDTSALTDVTKLQVSNNELKELDLANMTGLLTLWTNNNDLTSLNLSGLQNITDLRVSNNPNLFSLSVDENAKSKITTFYYHHTGIDTLDLNGFSALTVLSITKATNANLTNVKTFYATGSRSYDDRFIAYLKSTNTESFTWNSATTYYVINSNKGVSYGFGIPYEDEDGNLQVITSVYIDLAEGGLMDNEGNIIIGAKLTDVKSDGSIELPTGGNIVTPEGIFQFEGKVSIKDGIITTEDKFSYAKNGTTIDPETGSIIAEIGSVITTVEVDGTATVDSLGSEMNIPGGSIVTNDNGDKTFTSGPSVVDKDGNVSSDDYTVTVPSDKTGNVTTDGNNTKLPEGSTVIIGDESVTYTGEIIIDSETGEIKFLPFDALVTEDGKDLSSGVTLEDLEKAKDIIDNLPNGKLKDELKEKYENAQNIYDNKVSNAENAVDDLFNKDKTDLDDGVGQKEIDDAQKEVDKLPNGDKKDELQKEIDKAQDMLDAKDAVKDLFNPDGSVKDDVTQKDIDNAQKEIDKLPDGDLKEQLQNQINDAQKQKDQNDFVVITGFEIFTGKGAVSATIDAPVEKFTKVYVNNLELDVSNYEVTSGSTVITLKESYLLILENKTYDVEVEFVSGAKVSVPLTVNVKSNESVVPPVKTPSGNQTSTGSTSNVNTGDTTDFNLLYGMLVTSLLGLVVIIRRRKQV